MALSKVAKEILSIGIRAAKKKHSAKAISKARREINELSKLKDTPSGAVKARKKSKPRGVGVATRGYGRALR